MISIVSSLALGSKPNILYYAPSSSVQDHARIDMDQIALEAAFDGTTSQYDNVKAIYASGAHSKPRSTCTFDTAGPASDVASGTEITFTSVAGTTGVIGSAYSDYSAGDASITVKYKTSSDRVQPASSACHVGGMQPSQASYNTNGCVDTLITIGGTNYAVTCTHTSAGRTLKGFSTKAKGLMHEPATSGAPPAKTTDSDGTVYGVPYTSYTPYWNYYCKGSGTDGCQDDGGYADRLINAALDGTKTKLANFNMDFTANAKFHGGTGVTAGGRKQVIKKGTAYMNAWMYAIREYEDAIDDCATGDISNNDISVDKNAGNSVYNSVHAWDEGVAFYIGSNMTLDMFSGVDGAISDGGQQGKGYLAFTLGNKRCQNFVTCGLNGGSKVGVSQQNMKLFELLQDGQHDFLIGNCKDVVAVKDQVVAQMSIPLIQGTLRYAYKVGLQSGDDEARAEGAIFAAAILPRVHACDPAAASTIAAEMSLNKEGKPDFQAVKAAFEGCYSHMGVTCAEIGQYTPTVGNTPYEGAEACVDPTESDSDNTTIVIIVAAVAGVLFLCIVMMICKEKSGKPLFVNLKTAGSNSA